MVEAIEIPFIRFIERIHIRSNFTFLSYMHPLIDIKYIQNIKFITVQPLTDKGIYVKQEFSCISKIYCD